MRLYIYTNNSCMPVPIKDKETGEITIEHIGLAKMFTKAEELDECLAAWISAADMITLANSRAFITEDDVTFNDMDAFVITKGDLVFRQNFHHKKIEEIDMCEWANEYSAKVIYESQRLSQAKARSKGKDFKREILEAEHYLKTVEGKDLSCLVS